MSTMTVQMMYPQSLSPPDLDEYLSKGWFRSSSLLCRTSLICIEHDVYSVINIRLPLHDEFKFKKRLRKIRNRNDKAFRVEYSFAKIDEQREWLYQQNKHRFKGFVFDSLELYLYSDNLNQSLFDTREVAVYDGDKLIAVSYFDIGETSMASINCLHDETYGQYSLGTYTMIKEIEYGLEAGKSYYYPGYVLKGEPSFDYKLRLGDFQYYDWFGFWKDFPQVKDEILVVEFLKNKLQILSDHLDQAGIKHFQYVYPMFSSGHMDFYWGNLFKSPIFLVCFEPITNKPILAIEYDFPAQVYHLAVLEKNHKLKKMFFEVNYAGPKHEYQLNIDDLLEYKDSLLVEKDIQLLVDFLKGFKSHLPNN